MPTTSAPHRRRPRPATRWRRAQPVAARGAGGRGRSAAAARPSRRPLDLRCRDRGRRLHGAVDRPPAEGARARAARSCCWSRTSAAAGRPGATAASSMPGGTSWTRWGAVRRRARAGGGAGAVRVGATRSGRGASSNGVDAHYRHAGMLVVSTTRAARRPPLGSVAVAAAAGRARGVRGAHPGRGPGALRSPRFRNGAFMRDGATVQPALLARGLRRVALERGVVIHEQSTCAPRLHRDGPRTALAGRRDRPARMRLTARQVVLAMNAWAAGWRPFHRSILAWGSYMVRSEPIAEERLAELRLDRRRVDLHARASTSSTSTSPATGASPSAPVAACRATTGASVPRSPMTSALPGGRPPPSAPSSRSWPTCA